MGGCSKKNINATSFQYNAGCEIPWHKRAKSSVPSEKIQYKQRLKNGAANAQI